MDKKKILIPIIIISGLIGIFIVLMNLGTRYNRLIVSEEKWEEIKNTRVESNTIALEDIEFNDYNLIIDEKNNTLYYSLISNSSTKYNPKVSIKASEKNLNIVILSDEITDKKVISGYKFKLMIYNDNLYHIYNLVCTNLPLLNISYNESTNNKQRKIPIKVYLFNNLSDIPNRVTISNGRLDIGDNEYIFSLNMTTPGKNIRENYISLFNMKPNSEYVLRKNIKNAAVENHKLELFINNEYIGAYYLGYKTNRENKINQQTYKN